MSVFLCVIVCLFVFCVLLENVDMKYEILVCVLVCDM